MQNAIMAIWYHTDENSDHDFCPPSEKSWCGFQRDIAKGTSVSTHESPIPEAVADAIFPTLEALSEESLLMCCLSDGTQNQNEGSNSLRLATDNKRNARKHTNSRSGSFPSSLPLK